MSSGASPFHTDTPSALPPGTRLGEFELLSLLGVGGFGIVYLAFDHALEREVAVKEYMPASLAGRTETMHVSLRSHSDAESFALGLRSFVNEAKLLARFDHPSLLKVHRFWEANGTAYMAMPVLRGRTLKEIRAEMSGAPDEAWMRRVLMPLLGAIERLHSEGVYHRDIAPDNIQIEPDGRPVLLDFGAARRVLSDKSQALTAILKPAYAPIEQYGEAGSVRQGPWTDFYALGATLHYMLLGRPPPPATARTVHDEASSLTVDQLPGCGEAFLHTIDWMLCPRPIDRPQSAAELRHVLEGHAPPPVHRPAEGATLRWERTGVLPPHADDPRIDLDVGDQATQLISHTVPAGGVTEHVWLEPERAASITGGRSKPTDTTTVVRRGVGPTAESEHLDIVADSKPPGEGGSSVNGSAGAQGQQSKLPLMLGLLAAAVVAAAMAFWPQTEAPALPAALPTPAAATAGTAASAVALPSAVAAASVPALAAAADGASAAAAGASTAAALAASAAAGVTVPAAASPAAAESAVQTVVLPPAGPARRVEAPARAGAADKPAPARASSTRPAEPVRPRAETQAPARALAAAPPAAEPVPAGPGPACGSRDGVRYLVCMERECGRSEFASHPSCLRWKP